MHGPFILAVWLIGTAAQDGVAEFTARVEAYMTVRREAAQGVPADWIFEDPAEMLAERKALRQAIRDARRGARAGDLFTPRAAAAFRHIAAATAAEQRAAPKDIVRALRADRLPGARHPVVNAPYDWRLGAWMWPALLHALPPLPPDLQYRIVDDDLVLIDLRASLVVDILEDVITVDED